MLDFNADGDPVAPKDAATVVVVREGERGLEVFCVRRHQQSGFLGGAVVFPGGKVDESDRDPRWHVLATELTPRARQFSTDALLARAFAVAALRETLEEAAILPVVGDALDAGASTSLRRALDATTSTSLAELIESRNLTLDAGRLEALGRWITPPAERRRFDTRFYLLPLPTGQVGRHDEHETTHSFWATPRAILRAWESGEIFLAPPTSRTLELFIDAHDIDGAIGVARQQSLDPVCPHFTRVGDEVVLTLPGDPLHPERHPPPSDPTAPTRFVMHNGRFVGRRVG